MTSQSPSGTSPSPTEASCRVLLLDSNPRGRLMMAGLVRRSFSAVEPLAEASDLASARELIGAGLEPGGSQGLLLLMAELQFHDGCATELLAEAALRQCRKVILTLHADDRHIFEALRSGADGYLLKTEPLTRLVLALQGMAIGHPALSPLVAQRVLHHFRQRSGIPVASPGAMSGDNSQSPAESLSPRETQVLRLLSQGLTIAEVSRELKIRWFTVNDHVKAIYRKLGVASRAEAAVVAVRKGWV